MIFKFFSSYSQLNLFFLSSKKKEEIKEEIGLIEIEAIEIFEYGKNNIRYQNKAKLYYQIVYKALPIT